jgi:hypothetical protein
MKLLPVTSNTSSPIIPFVRNREACTIKNLKVGSCLCASQLVIHPCKVVYKNEPLRLMTAMPIFIQSPTPTDEDGLLSTPLRSISRRKSRLKQWVEDQHAHPDEDQNDGTTQGSSQKPYPYLAYSDMRRSRSGSCDDDSGSISESFVLVDNGDENGPGSPGREERSVFDEVNDIFT